MLKILKHEEDGRKEFGMLMATSQLYHHCTLVGPRRTMVELPCIDTTTESSSPPAPEPPLPTVLAPVGVSRQ